MPSKKSGFFLRGSRWVIVFPGDTESGWREISLPQFAKDVLEEHYAPHPSSIKSQRMNAAADPQKYVNNTGANIIGIVKDSLESDIFELSPEQDAHVTKVFDAVSGRKLKGREKPYAKVLEDEDAQTGKIILSAPAKMDLVILYSIVDEDFDEQEM